MATHSGILAGKMPWTDGLQFIGLQESDTTEQLNTHICLFKL